MKQIVLITFIFFCYFTQNSYSQEKCDSVVIIMKEGGIYRLNISHKTDLKTYRKIIKDQDKIKTCEKKTEIGSVYSIVDTNPEFFGDINNFRKYISKNMIYPREAAEKGDQGTISIQFIVSENGEVINVKAINWENWLLKEEALRVVKSSPKWKPGLVNNLPVKVELTFPITFVLN